MLAASGALATLPARGLTGSEVFTANCIACHGTDGKAKTPAGKKLGAKDLTVSKISDAEIRKQVADGFKNSSGVQMMPAFKDVLSPDQIEAVIGVVKKLRKN